MAVPNAKKAGIILPGKVAPKVSVDGKDTRAGSNAPGEAAATEWSKTASKASSDDKGEGRSSAKATDTARYRLLEGDPLKMEAWGKGTYDVVIVPHYLHLLDVAGMRAVLGKARRALKPDGR